MKDKKSKAEGEKPALRQAGIGSISPSEPKAFPSADKDLIPQGSRERIKGYIQQIKIEQKRADMIQSELWVKEQLLEQENRLMHEMRGERDKAEAELKEAEKEHLELLKARKAIKDFQLHHNFNQNRIKELNAEIKRLEHNYGEITKCANSLADDNRRLTEEIAKLKPLVRRVIE